MAAASLSRVEARRDELRREVDRKAAWLAARSGGKGKGKGGGSGNGNGNGNGNVAWVAGDAAAVAVKALAGDELDLVLDNKYYSARVGLVGGSECPATARAAVVAISAGREFAPAKLEDFVRGFANGVDVRLVWVVDAEVDEAWGEDAAVRARVWCLERHVELVDEAEGGVARVREAMAATMWPDMQRKSSSRPAVVVAPPQPQPPPSSAPPLQSTPPPTTSQLDALASMLDRAAQHKRDLANLPDDQRRTRAAELATAMMALLGADDGDDDDDDEEDPNQADE